MTKTTGRPAKYGYEDLARAVAQAEAEFGTPTPAQVKATLCAQLGIAKTLNDASFQAALGQFYDDRETARQKSLIAGLPETVRKNAVEQVRGQLEHAILQLLGASYATVREDAQRQVAAADQLTRDVTFKVRHLEADLAAKNGAIVEITAERDAARAQVGTLEGEVAELKQRLAAQVAEERGETRMRESFRQLLSEITATPIQKAQVTALLYSLPSRSEGAA